MALLQFDPSGALNPEYGITESQLSQCLESLLPLRQEMVDVDPQQYASGNIPSEKQPLDARFFWLPEEQLAAYEKHRDASELGRIFNVANGMHDRLDAVVTLGIGGSYMGARAMMEACCDPYHNELSRGRRGSKPRMYFEGNNVDNDASSALLQRLAAGSCEDTAVSDRWGICVISKSGGTMETAVAFRQFLAALEKSLDKDAASQLSDFVFPVTGESGKLHDLATQIGCPEIFAVPDGVGGRFSVLSAVGLLPAAILGLDCMQLLAGAVEMNEHFKNAAPEDNVVLKYVATNHLLEKHRGCNIRVMSVWSKALESVGMWYDQLLAESNGKEGKGATPLTTVNTRDLHSRHQQHQQGHADKVFNNVIVKNYRTDPLTVGHSDRNQDGLNDLADKTLPQLMDAAIKGTNEALHADGRPTTDIVLPTIDTHVLGQLFQMLMIATVIEGRLLGINPYGQPGVEQYKKNMNKNLGRA
ncbi:Glucose-6-phosphate isomerase [Roseimaritima multifibrata]|uniref:Glucose-6-phosphate isomerase n=1 Tax=Roseimaritima multifibrata TaxID=1930274 RepID=A0A517MKH1_9BACT|nr:glucose-6-phosphate isomerase [Roseimaritima multifibrata]QDS95340.1 Glucose-6-phosphate isomerase [Roseimaritima multifibrata]